MESRTLASSKVPKDTVDAFGGMPKSGVGLVTVRGASGTLRRGHAGAASSWETSGLASYSSSELSSLVASRDVPSKEREKTGTGKKRERNAFFPFLFLHFWVSAALSQSAPMLSSTCSRRAGRSSVDSERWLGGSSVPASFLQQSSQQHGPL